ncbi:hypothetical protein H131_20502 [Lysinibacillus sphaericus OT4b.31]|uniref:Uncharacterized protein n=1 Tax=Lysinibacillus sphaericus OT4b.31 TaxID=1285586 RepID=R7Z910_LYSSH|nr:hypothetical protein H131_20502 [Lysinibacillus sphaericus OT4b.31]
MYYLFIIVLKALKLIVEPSLKSILQDLEISVAESYRLFIIYHKIGKQNRNHAILILMVFLLER